MDVRSRSRVRAARLIVALAVFLAGAGLLALNRYGGFPFTAAPRPTALAPIPTPSSPLRPIHQGGVGGSVRVFDREAGWTPLDECASRGAFSDLKENTRITVIDRAGQTLGVTYLSAGSGDRISDGEVVCDFGFAFPDIDLGKGSYGFQVGQRPTVVWFPESEVFDPGGDLRLPFGAP